MMRSELSDRELSVVALAAEGLSNPEIAERLGLSPNTIRTHLRRIYLKLRVSGRIGMVQALRPKTTDLDSLLADLKHMRTRRTQLRPNGPAALHRTQGELGMLDVVIGKVLALQSAGDPR